MHVESAARINEVGARDLEIALGLLVRFFDEHGFSPLGGDLRSALAQMIKDPDSAVFLCRDGDIPVGVITVTSGVNLEYGRSAEIEDLYVVPEARRGGIGARMVERALAWSRLMGCSTVLVTLVAQGTEGDTLLSFYQRHGFQPNTRRILECPL